MEMVQENRLPHALMFCGPQGCGKLAMALAFASYLLGDSPMLRKWEHPDLHFTFPTIKTANMGTLYELQYRVTLRDAQVPKAFLDALRCRNGNLNITCGREQTGEAL